MPSLSMVKVLESLKRESMIQVNRGDSDWVQFKVLANRLRNEYTRIAYDSVPVLASRYLKNAVILKVVASLKIWFRISSATVMTEMSAMEMNAYYVSLTHSWKKNLTYKLVNHI